MAYIDEVVYYYRMGGGHLSHTQKIVSNHKEWYDDSMRKLFMHAWTQRGYHLDEGDIRFIHDFLYTGALVWKARDVWQGISAFRKVKSNSTN